MKELQFLDILKKVMNTMPKRHPIGLVYQTNNRDID
jgi:hypothetical protein